MSAFFTEEQLALLGASTVRCDFLCKFEFASETLYAWNGRQPLEAGGNSYQPMHGMAAIEGLGYAGGATSESVTLSLSGLPDQNLDLLAIALDDTPEVDQQIVTISLQLFDADWQTVGMPIPVFFGFMQPPQVSRSAMQGEEGSVQSIQIVAENAMFNRARPPFGRNTDRDQQGRYPGDKFFGFVAGLLFKQITYPDY